MLKLFHLGDNRDQLLTLSRWLLRWGQLFLPVLLGLLLGYLMFSIARDLIVSLTGVLVYLLTIAANPLSGMLLWAIAAINDQPRSPRSDGNPRARLRCLAHDNARVSKYFTHVPAIIAIHDRPGADTAARAPVFVPFARPRAQIMPSWLPTAPILSRKFTL